MATCPTCFVSYPDDEKTCAKDGAALVPDATFAHVDRDIQPGTVVGEYTVESKLGQGGFGAVYRAVHPLIGKRAAVKVLSREFSSNPQMVSRFIAEARAVNQIRHRNIIDIFSFGQLPDGRQYYIMELLDGVTFDAYLSKQKRLDLAAAMPILRGVARALDAAHAKGILHRDLKPENVFLVQHDDGSVEPKLLDFGLVKLIDPKSTLTGDASAESDSAKSGSDSGGHNTKTGTPMGTPYYMSPEQCRGLEVDARTDVYSFGAMVFEVLTGELPFTGHSTLDILIQHMSSPPPAASSRCAAVPASIDGPLAQIMAKDPNARPAHVGEALDFLARAADIAVPTDSQRTFHVDSASMSAAERAVAPTVMAVGPSNPPASPVSTPSRPAQTFLGTESSIAPPRKSRAPLLAATGALLLGAAIVVIVNLDRTPAPIVPAATSAPAVVVEKPKADEDVELRVDGAPEGTTIRADGVALGTGSGPFKVKRGKSIALEFSAKGYKSKDLTVKPDENMLLSVELEKVADKPAETTPPAPAPTTKPAGTKIHKDLEGFDSK